ncbi:MAG: ComF family protein [Saccharofermentans sp.]|nr:ComF family protein [Saccharofermentans sp.]
MGILKDAVSLLLPPVCSVCGKLADTSDRMKMKLPGDLVLCFDCLSRMVPEDKDRRWLLCLSNPYIGDPIPSMPLYMPFRYEGFFKDAIASVKFKKDRDLAVFLGSVLGKLAQEDNITGDIIVPIPLSHERQKQRGFNQALIIAQEMSKKLHIPVAKDILIRTRDTLRQSELKMDESRASNMKDAFAVAPDWDISGSRILIVDDVVTTGHTLHEAGEVLTRAGALSVAGIVLCGNRYVKNDDPF